MSKKKIHQNFIAFYLVLTIFIIYFIINSVFIEAIIDDYSKISISKSSYVVGDTVEININLSTAEREGYNLEIFSSSKKFTYRGDFNEFMLFYPTEIDLYTVALVERSTGMTVYKKDFNVVGVQTVTSISENSISLENNSILNTYQNNISLENNLTSVSNLIPNNINLRNYGSLDIDNPSYYLATLFSLKKRTFLLDENIDLIYQESLCDKDCLESIGSIKLFYNDGLSIQPYSGDIRALRFRPSRVGSQELIFADAQGIYLGSLQFNVSDRSKLKKNVRDASQIRPKSDTELRSDIKIRDNANAALRSDFYILNEDNSSADLNEFRNPSPSKKFNIEVIPYDGSVNSIILRGVTKSVGSQLSFGVERVGIDKTYVKSKKSIKSFSIDPTQVNFSSGTVSSIAEGSELWKCKEWNYTTQTCFGNWTKLMDLIPGEEYSFEIDAFDPGFTETSPSTGTADAGGVVNIVNANYNNGNFASTQVNDNTFWALGRSNGGAQQLDSHGYLNFTFNVSIINYTSIYQVTDLQLNVSYCHSADVTAPTTCSALLTGVDFGNNSIEIYNYSSSRYFQLGLLQNRSGVEGINSYNQSGGIYDFIDPILGTVNIRMWSNFTITINGRDAVLAVDHAQLTLILDTIYPEIGFVNPLEANGAILSRNYSRINITANDTRLTNLTLYIYDQFGSIYFSNSSNVTTNTTSFFHNLTQFTDGIYYYNATACDFGGLCNFTSTRNFTVDTGAPGINFIDPTPAEGFFVGNDYVSINVSAQDPNYANMSLFFYNSSGDLVSATYTTQTNISRNFTGLIQGIYFYNVTACDTSSCGFSATRNFTIDTVVPSMQFVNPTENSGIWTNRTYLQANLTSTDLNFLNHTIFLYDFYGVLMSSFSSSSSPLFVNFTNLLQGTYYINASACDSAGNCNYTQTVLVNLYYYYLDVKVPGSRGAMVAYTENGVNTPRYRIWNGTSFGTEQSANNVGATSEWLALKSNPTKYEYILATADTGDDINVQFYSYLSNGTLCWNNGTSCESVREFETVGSTGSYQKVDVAYSQLSGIAIMVYTDTSTAPDVARFVVWNGSTWSLEATVPQTILTGNMEQVKLAERPNSDEIALAMTDSNDDVNFMIWNGSGWGCEPASIQRSTLATTAYQTVDITYEQLSGDLFAAITDTTASEFYYSVKPADTCTYNVSVTTSLTIAAPEIISSAAQSGSDFIITVMRDNGGNDVQALVWNGTDMLAASSADIDAFAEASPNQLIAAGWAGERDTGLILYADNANQTGLNYMVYNKTSNTWQSSATGQHTTGTDGINNFTASERNYVVKSFFEENKLIAIIQDDASDLWAKIFNSSDQTWYDADSGVALETESISGALESTSFDFAWDRTPSVSGIIFTDPTETSNEYVNRSYLQANISINPDLNYITANISIFNSTGSLVNLTTTTGYFLFVNLTILTEGRYYFNASACDVIGYCNFTETRNITFDFFPPSINFTTPTDLSGQYYYRNYTQVNVSASDFNEINIITIYLYNSSGGLNASNITNITSFFMNFTDLTQGIYYINATACDMSGKCNSTQNLTIYLDTEFPQISFELPTESPGALFRINYFSVNVSASDLFLNNITVRVYNLTGVLVRNITGIQNNLTTNITSIEDGFYYYNATACDRSGKCNFTETRNLTIDTTLPSIQFVSPTETSGASVVRNYTMINVSAQDINLLNITIYIYNSSGVLINLSNTTEANIFINITDLIDGLYFFNATACDSIANCNSTETRNFTLDNLAPNIDFVAPTEVSGFFADRSYIMINITTKDSFGLRNVSFYLYHENGTLINLTTSNSGFFANITGISDGVYFYNATAFDNAGNFNFTETRNITMTGVGTQVNLIYPLNLSMLNFSLIQFNYSVVDLVYSIENCSLQINGQINETNSSIVESTELTFYGRFLNDGNYTWNVTCVNSNDVIQYSLTYNFSIDSTAPVTTLINPVDDEFIHPSDYGNVYQLNASAVDNNSVTVFFQYRYNSSSLWQDICNSTVGSIYSCNWNLAGLSFGESYEVRAYALDSFGNIGLADSNANITINASQFVNITYVLVDDDILVPINEVDLIAGSTKKVLCNITATDPFDYQNLIINATFHLSSIAASEPDDSLNHYTNNTCNLTFGFERTGEFICAFDVYYFASPGNWTCLAGVQGNLTSAYLSDNTSINQIFAVNISSELIDYQSIPAGQVSSDVSVNISNLGNVPINISVYGYGGENATAGANLSMICNVNNISVSDQRFAINSAPFDSKIALSSVPQDIGLTILPSQNISELNQNSTFWQIQAPATSYSFGQCNGSLIFMAEASI